LPDGRLLAVLFNNSHEREGRGVNVLEEDTPGTWHMAGKIAPDYWGVLDFSYCPTINFGCRSKRTCWTTQFRFKHIRININ